MTPCASTATAVTGSCSPAGTGRRFDPRNAPAGYDVFSCQVATGKACVLVQDDIAVSTG